MNAIFAIRDLVRKLRMQIQKISGSLSDFYLIGISYEKTNTTTRSLFAVDDEVYERIAEQVSNSTLSELYVLSTCNRTEVYGFAGDAEQLIHLLCKETLGTAEQFIETAYILRGEAAVRHLYEVGCGLDSQILGDFEIISQVKKAAQKARKAKLLGAFTERLLSSVLQASKKVKNETGLSAGTVSVSYAVVQYLKQIPDIKVKRILLLGVGKIGRNACKNLINYLGTRQITLVNRTEETAKAYALQHGLAYAPYESLADQLKYSDIVLVATNASTPTIHKEDICEQNKVIVDLSIPNNVSEEVKSLPNLKVVDIDELSHVQDATLEVRKKEIPGARAIIEEKIEDFLHWHQKRKQAFILKGMKEKMEEIHQKEIKKFRKTTQANPEELETLSAHLVQRMVNVFGGKLKSANGKADHYCQILSEFFEIPDEK